MLMDEFIGPDAIAEQGVRYRYFAIGEIAVVAMANMGGVIWALHSKHKAAKARNQSNA